METRNPDLFVRYRHRGAQNWVRRDLQGKQGQYSLCAECWRYQPGGPGQCPRAFMLEALTRLSGRPVARRLESMVIGKYWRPPGGNVEK